MGIDVPLMLVGQSAGAYELLLLADRRAGQVAGMVLLDPSFPGQAEAAMQAAPALNDPNFEDPQVAMLQGCAAAMRDGSAAERRECLVYPPVFPAVLAAKLAAHADGNALLFESAASFIGGFAGNSAMVVDPARDYGDMPLTVLTALDRALPPDMPEDMRAGFAAFDVHWFAAHEALAALSTRGIDARVPGGTHALQISKPQVVIDAVEAVVREIRTTMPIASQRFQP